MKLNLGNPIRLHHNRSLAQKGPSVKCIVVIRFLSDSELTMATRIRDKWLAAFRAATNSLPSELARDYKGRIVGCWCPLDAPCHGDVCWEWANGVR